MQNLCPSQNIIKTNKSRLMRCSVLTAGVGKNKNLYISLAGKIESKGNCFKFLGIYWIATIEMDIKI